MSPLPEPDAQLLAQRARLGLGLALLSNGLFTLADLEIWPPEIATVLVLKAVQVAALLIAFRVLARDPPPRRTIGTALAALAIVYGATALSGVATRDVATTPILCSVVTLLAATLLPWGPWAQLAAVGLAAAAICSTLLLITGSLTTALTYPAVGVAFGLGASVYIAAVFRRYREALAAKEQARQDVEAALRAREADLRGIFDGLQDVFVRVGLDGRVMRVSPSVARYGLQPEAMVDEPIARFFRNADERRRGSDELGRSGMVRDWEVTVTSPDGTEVPMSVVARLVRDDSGRALYVEGLLHDVTGPKRAEAEIRRLNEDLTRRAAELEVANRELEAFSYSVAHDLRGPLRGIDSFSSILAEDFGDRLGAEGTGHLQRVRAAAQRMGQLIDDLLALSRVTRAELRREVVDLSGLVHALVAELRQREPQRAVELVVAEHVVAGGDAVLLRVALQNLLENAWKFSAPRPVARIEFGTTTIDGEVAYFVRDNGVGFDMTYANKLFGAFQRLHDAKQFEGTGIGLATVERIIRRHRGRVWAEGAIDGGATFYFVLGGADSNGAAPGSATPAGLPPQAAERG